MFYNKKTSCNNSTHRSRKHYDVTVREHAVRGRGGTRGPPPQLLPAHGQAGLPGPRQVRARRGHQLRHDPRAQH